jgi:DHA1 family tetracycline resistance protein-like MFS transporter
LLKRVDRRLFTILSIVFVQLAGAAMILPILPLFAERQFSMHPATITLLVSSYFAAQFFAGPYLGELSDQYGRIPLLVISQLGSAVSFFMIAAAGNVWVLFAARILDGITGGNIIVAQAYITDVTPREKRTEALGYILAVFGLGFIIGPALGGLLAAWLGARMPFVVAGLAALVTAGMSWFLLDETITRLPSGERQPRRKRLSFREALRNSSLLLTLVIGFIGQFGLGMLQSTFALFGAAVLFANASEQITNLGVGLLLAVVGAGQFVTQTWLIGPMKRRFGDGRLVIIGTVLRGAGLLLLAVIASPWAAALSSLLFAVGQGLMMPPLQSMATRTMPDAMRGAVLGLFQSSVSLATIISTAIAGVIFSINASIPFWVGGLLSLLVVVPGTVLMRRSQAGELQPQGTPGPAD